jgi:hypothetical protein
MLQGNDREKMPVARWIALSAALLLGACAAAGAVGGGSISADVGLSEWVPPGRVDLDVATGRYRLRPARPRIAPEGTVMPIRIGRLAAEELRPVRKAFGAALSRGLIEPVCAKGGRPAQIAVSNAPTPLMLLRSQRRTVAASPELGCWTDAAMTLHSILERTFDRRSEERW